MSVDRFGPYPFHPFDGPTEPPAAENLGGFCLQVDRKWLPYLLACALTLTAEQTWAYDADRAIGEAQAIILALIEGVACNNIATVDTTGIEIELCDMKLRFCNNKLQVCDCGTWVDVPSCDGDTGNPGGGSQPGGGSPQPQPGGHSAHYCGAMGGPSKWYLPTKVSSGDTLLFSELGGAWNDPVELAWHCPDGWLFLDGNCAQTVQYNSSGDPLIGARHMQIVAKIGSVYYDPLRLDIWGAPQEFVVPSGHVSDPVVLLANYDYTDTINGDVTFCVSVTNNGLAQWQHIFHPNSGLGGWQAFSCAGSQCGNPCINEIAGSFDIGGWHSITPACEGDQLLYCFIDLPMSATITNVRFSGSSAAEIVVDAYGGGLNARVFVGGVLHNGSYAGALAGLWQYSQDFGLSGVTRILVAASQYFSSTATAIHEIIVTGTGPDPFAAP